MITRLPSRHRSRIDHARPELAVGADLDLRPDEDVGVEHRPVADDRFIADHRRTARRPHRGRAWRTATTQRQRDGPRPPAAGPAGRTSRGSSRSPATGCRTGSPASGVAPKCVGTTTAPAFEFLSCGAYFSSASQAICDGIGLIDAGDPGDPGAGVAADHAAHPLGDLRQRIRLAHGHTCRCGHRACGRPQVNGARSLAEVHRSRTAVLGEIRVQRREHLGGDVHDLSA